MSENDKVVEVSGVLLSLEESNNLISRFRKLYHQGVPAIYDENFRSKIEPFLKEEQEIKFIPTDILELRLKIFSDPMLKIPAKVGTLPSYFYFPKNTIEVTPKILKHQAFLALPSVYLSIGSVGEKVYRSVPEAIKEFFDVKPDWQTPNYYVFDDDLEWCIAITHEDEYLLTGNFHIFAKKEG